MSEVLSLYTNSPIEVVQNWVNSDDVRLIDRSKSSILLSLGWNTGDVVFQFFGNMGRLQGIENILLAIKNVKSARAKFLFIGDGARSEKILDYIYRENPSNLRYLGPLDMAHNDEGLAACDVSIVSLAPGMYGLGVPSKFYFSLAAGKQVLAVMDNNSEVSRSVIEHDLGWTCQANDPIALARVIDKICDGYSQFASRKNYEVFLNNFDAKILLPKITEIVNNLR